jgi:hypothetical protein
MSKYQAQIEKLHEACNRNYRNFVKLILRNNSCLDMDSPRVAIEYAGQGDRPAVVPDPSLTHGTEIAAYYDYFVYVNCGVTGPSPQWANQSWTSIFLRELRD